MAAGVIFDLDRMITCVKDVVEVKPEKKKLHLDWLAASTAFDAGICYGAWAGRLGYERRCPGRVIVPTVALLTSFVFACRTLQGVYWISDELSSRCRTA
jgi:hypothetical protein